jgi:S-adenosylmethionine:tRNA ribosyltransferase-isomerase
MSTPAGAHVALRAATWPRDDRAGARLLRIDTAHGTLSDSRVRDLPRHLRRGDLLVVNDAATLPASLAARTADGAQIEVRLCAAIEEGLFRAALLGAGDWRTPTEHRPPPPPLHPGDELVFAERLRATITFVSALSPRLVDLRFEAGPELWVTLHRLGRPVQYAYLRAPLELWHVQTVYASRPWAVEMPSAGAPLDWALLTELRRAGVQLAALTHAAGLSSTGDPAIDTALPLPERYEMPAATVAAVEATRARGGRVVATGTSVVRALEGNFADFGRLRPARGLTDLRIGAAHRLQVVDGLLSGLHEPGASHFDLLEAFAARNLLEAAHAHAAVQCYRHHEFGDALLLV